MAPRQDRTHPLLFGHSNVNSRLTSTKGGYYNGGGFGSLEGGINGFRGVNEFYIRNNVSLDLLNYANVEPKKKTIFNNNNKRKARLNMTHHAAVQERKHKVSPSFADEPFAKTDLAS